MSLDLILNRFPSELTLKDGFRSTLRPLRPSDELGFHAVENRHYVTDIHATVMKLLGLDSYRLEIPGRKRLEIDHGEEIGEIIA